MNKYLIFRTDRIGDFLLSMILIKNIKRNDKNSYIIVVSSEKNYDYIKTFNLVDKVIKLKKGYINRFKLILRLFKHKFKFSIIHDGKKRSKFINFFLKKDNTLKVNNDDIKKSHFFKIKKIINSMDFKFDFKDLDILTNRSFSNKYINEPKYIIFHYDEKWSNTTYISKYVDIEPTKAQLLNFINNIRYKSGHQIIITTGINTPEIIKNIISEINDHSVKLIEGLNFEQLEKIVSHSKLLISCHGAISHVASAYNIRQIDIIDINTKNPYSNWTDHFRNYSSIYRESFPILSSKILNNDYFSQI
jgi:ADP-heptose:LPS heptosyltransferase